MDHTIAALPELVEGLSLLSRGEEGQPFDKLRVSGLVVIERWR